MDPEKFPGLSAYDTRAMVFGTDRRVVLTHSGNLHTKQSAGFEQTLAKATRALAELAATLARGKTRRNRAAVLADIAAITGPRWLNRVYTTTLTGDNPATFSLAWALDPKAVNALATELFGKRILFTDRDHWPVVDVVAAYRSQIAVENDFRQMKDRRGRKLSFAETQHYQKTIAALSETIRLMAQIDSLIADHGGWPLA